MGNAAHAPRIERPSTEKRPSCLRETQASYAKASPESKQKTKQIRTVENKGGQMEKRR